MKERLTGAIILVALIVLLVPELLTGPIRSQPAPQVAAPSAEEPPLRSYTIDLADDSRGRTTVSASSGSAAPTPSGPAQPEPIAATAAPESSVAAQSSLAAGGSDPPAGTPTASGQQNAAGEGAQAPVAEGPKGSIPEQGVGADTAERPVPERPSKPRTTSPASAQGGSGAWMVQLGTFANRANAERLTQELKGKGFHASVSESSGSGRKLYRVRAGPTSDHAAAEQLAARLRAAGHPGSIVPRS